MRTNSCKPSSAAREGRPAGRPYTTLRDTQAWALWLLGESTARQASAESEPAAGHYRQALALAEELGMRPLQEHCRQSLSTLYARQKQRQPARATLAIAIDLYRDMGMTFWLPQTQEALAQVEAP